MPHRTAQVDQPALGQQDDAAPILQPVAVHLQVGRAALRAGGAMLPVATPASSYPLVQQASLLPTSPVKDLHCPRVTSSIGPGTLNNRQYLSSTSELQISQVSCENLKRIVRHLTHGLAHTRYSVSIKLMLLLSLLLLLLPCALG